MFQVITLKRSFFDYSVYINNPVFKTIEKIQDDGKTHVRQNQLWIFLHNSEYNNLSSFFTILMKNVQNIVL